MRYFDLLETVSALAIGYGLTVLLAYLFFHRIFALHHVVAAMVGLGWLGALRRYRGLSLSPWRIWHNRRDAVRFRTQSEETKRLRIAALAADPVKRKYVPLVERGEVWSDDEIDYNEDAQMTVSCTHLQPIERAMRLAGLHLRRLTGPNVKADCRIDEAGLKQRYAPGPEVQYREWYQPERHWSDNPQAEIACDECRSAIRVIHRAAVGEQTPWFPGPPLPA